MTSPKKTYLPLFQTLGDTPGWQLDGDNMLVEVFDEGEDAKEITREDGSKVSLVLAAPTKERQLGSFEENKPLFVRVLKVGRGYFKEDGSVEPVDLKPGAIVEVPKLAVSWRSKVLGIVSTEKKLGFVTRSSVLQSFTSETEYQALYNQTKGSTS